MQRREFAPAKTIQEFVERYPRLTEETKKFLVNEKIPLELLLNKQNANFLLKHSTLAPYSKTNLEFVLRMEQNLQNYFRTYHQPWIIPEEKKGIKNFDRYHSMLSSDVIKCISRSNSGWDSLLEIKNYLVEDIQTWCSYPEAATLKEIMDYEETLGQDARDFNRVVPPTAVCSSLPSTERKSAPLPDHLGPVKTIDEFAMRYDLGTDARRVFQEAKLDTPDSLREFISSDRNFKQLPLVTQLKIHDAQRRERKIQEYTNQYGEWRRADTLEQFKEKYGKNKDIAEIMSHYRWRFVPDPARIYNMEDLVARRHLLETTFSNLYRRQWATFSSVLALEEDIRNITKYIAGNSLELASTSASSTSSSESKAPSTINASPAKKKETPTPFDEVIIASVSSKPSSSSSSSQWAAFWSSFPKTATTESPAPSTSPSS